MFSFLRMRNSAVSAPTIKNMPTTAGTTYKVGDALALSSGALVLATGTTKPEFISAGKYTAPATGMQPLAVYPINGDMEWDTTFSAAATAIVPGDKVTIGSGGDTVTATTTSGVAEVIEKIGTGASGDRVIVKF